MATISITIPDAQLQRVLDGLVPPGSDLGGLTQPQAAKAKIITFIKSEVRASELEAIRIAASRATSTIDDDPPVLS